MRESLTLRSPSPDGPILRTASVQDLDSLRVWKNESREYFFHKDIITADQQLRWFQGYLDRPADFMFMVLVNEDRIGCIGVRRLDHEWDIYNVMLGDQKWRGSGLMSQALGMVCRYAGSVQDQPVSLKVLSSNPARGWYAKNGFSVRATGPDFESMVLDPRRFREIAIDIAADAKRKEGVR